MTTIDPSTDDWPDHAVREALPPLTPPENRRHERYDGTGVGVPLASFPDEVGATLHRQYDHLASLLGTLRTALGLAGGDGGAPGGLSHGSPDVSAAEAGRRGLARARDACRDAATDPAWNEMVRAVRVLAARGLSGDAEEAAVRALHDVRGGAFQALALLLELEAGGLGDDADGLRVFYLVRDHLKIMRSAITDIDPEARARDRVRREHDIRLLLEKWGDAMHRVDGAVAHVRARSGYGGAVSACCLEFAALDRVLYNLINNATRFAADRQVRLEIIPLPADAASDLRFVVSNVLTRSHDAVLRERFPDGLAPLFDGGFTTGGDGDGLAVCADIVAHAYGMGATEAVRSGHLGATLAEDAFVAWFHWPTVD